MDSLALTTTTTTPPSTTTASTMARHSLIPASAPTSPAVSRSRSDRNPPTTPQRAIHSSYVYQNTSPLTPGISSTPYTPQSFNSYSSSNASSLATPASNGRRRLSLSLSPELSVHAKSLADATGNWRDRASENGIKVTSGAENNFLTRNNQVASAYSPPDLQKAPFLSTQRRTRAISSAQAPLSQVPNHAQLSTPSRTSISHGVLNTPPPQPSFKLRGSVTDPPHTRRRPLFGHTSELCDIDEDEYAPYPSAFCGAVASQTLPLVFADTFPSDLSNFSDSSQFFETERIEVQRQANACSVCESKNGPLAILQPCMHPLCSVCLTSALNIVGEKDMECASCKTKVDNFKLQMTSVCTAKDDDMQRPLRGDDSYPTFAEFDSGIGLLPSAFDNRALQHGGFAEYDDFISRAQGASTPVAEHRNSARGKETEPVVLRIDNVPWDITPPAIAAWIKHPVERVHVLLDRKGKTLSHAYVEMVNADAAKAALRSSQNAVLGKGKRARGVTVTKSSQEELMRALFPSWQGNFDGSRPSLAGLSNEHVISTLQRGILSEAELNSLLLLIRSPDSHFLKVPSLPFHSLISLLSKFPADDDSKVFWSVSLRDALYEVTYAAVQVLMAQIEENPLSDSTTLMAQVVRAAMDCQAFTSEQMSKLSDILEAALPQSMSSPLSSHLDLDTPDTIYSECHQPLQTRSVDRDLLIRHGAYGDIAKEFGVEPCIVEALAQRLSKIH